MSAQPKFQDKSPLGESIVETIAWALMIGGCIFLVALVGAIIEAKP